jgi:hypothetical protein
MNLAISRLVVNFENAHGHEHRIQAIASRAVGAFAEHIASRLIGSGSLFRSTSIEALQAPAVALDLDRTSDEQAARRIAGAWFEALAPHLKA